MWYVPIILSPWEAVGRRVIVQDQFHRKKHKTLHKKITKVKKKSFGEVAQVAEHLLSKCEALISNPSTSRKRKEKEKGRWYLQMVLTLHTHTHTHTHTHFEK
jgi:primosomal protein N''